MVVLGNGARMSAAEHPPDAIRVDERDHYNDDWSPPFDPKDVIRIRSDAKFTDLYTLYEEIGEGKFGKVFRCVEKSTNLELAAKCIRLKKDADLAKVEKEVQIMTQIRHKCIAQIYDAFATASNEIVLIMEILSGGELFDRVVDDSFILTETAVAMIMYQILEAIRYIHNQSIIHLDLKPENIMCVSLEGNQIKLIDFGLAQYYDGQHDLLFMAGTPEFAAPEVIKYEPLDFHTDMWSLGVIAYILLSGQSPFLGDNIALTYCNVEKGKWEFCEEFDDNGISAEARDFISKLLIVDKSKRMLPDECLRHEWITSSLERARQAALMHQPTVGKQLPVGKLRSYVRNKRFRRLVFGVLFVNSVVRMLSTLQDKKSDNGVQYVRNMLSAVDGNGTQNLVKNAFFKRRREETKEEPTAEATTSAAAVAEEAPDAEETPMAASPPKRSNNGADFDISATLTLPDVEAESPASSRTPSPKPSKRHRDKADKPKRPKSTSRQTGSSTEQTVAKKTKAGSGSALAQRVSAIDAETTVNAAMAPKKSSDLENQHPAIVETKPATQKSPLAEKSPLSTKRLSNETPRRTDSNVAASKAVSALTAKFENSRRTESNDKIEPKPKPKSTLSGLAAKFEQRSASPFTLPIAGAVAPKAEAAEIPKPTPTVTVTQPETSEETKSPPKVKKIRKIVKVKSNVDTENLESTKKAERKSADPLSSPKPKAVAAKPNDAAAAKTVETTPKAPNSKVANFLRRLEANATDSPPTMAVSSFVPKTQQPVAETTPSKSQKVVQIDAIADNDAATTKTPTSRLLHPDLQSRVVQKTTTKVRQLDAQTHSSSGGTATVPTDSVTASQTTVVSVAQRRRLHDERNRLVEAEAGDYVGERRAEVGAHTAAKTVAATASLQQRETVKLRHVETEAADAKPKTRRIVRRKQLTATDEQSATGTVTTDGATRRISGERRRVAKAHFADANGETESAAVEMRMRSVLVVNEELKGPPLSGQTELEREALAFLETRRRTKRGGIAERDLSRGPSSASSSATSPNPLMTTSMFADVQLRPVGERASRRRGSVDAATAAASRRSLQFDAENVDELLQAQQDAFDFSHLRAKLEQRLLCRRDSDAVDVAEENWQQKSAAMAEIRQRLADTGNIQRAMHKWKAMERQTQQCGTSRRPS